MQFIGDFGKKAPCRYFSEPTRWAINGETVLIEHKWHAVPAVGVPSFGWTEGVSVTMDCCALLAFKYGKIIHGDRFIFLQGECSFCWICLEGTRSFLFVKLVQCALRVGLAIAGPMASKFLSFLRNTSPLMCNVRGAFL
jgi:hypothetical protein